VHQVSFSLHDYIERHGQQYLKFSFFIYLFVYYPLFNNSVIISSCAESNYEMMIDYEYGKNVDGSSHVNVWCTVSAFVWRK
jgi:hypothetical protein